MKVTQKIEQLDDGQEDFYVYFDDKVVFNVYDGEPEDNTLKRNFSDCLNLKDLFEEAYNKGYRDGVRALKSIKNVLNNNF